MIKKIYIKAFLNSYYGFNSTLRFSQKEDVDDYICTCGQYYTLGNCTCPIGTFICDNSNVIYW